MMTVHNEADIVGQVIEHLISQGIELVVLDNGSTDGSYEIIQHHIGKGILSVNRMETKYFETESIFGTLHAMVTQYSPDWMLLTASDEFLSISVYLHALEAYASHLVSKTDLSKDLKDFRCEIESDFSQEIAALPKSGNRAPDGWDWIYSLRNASLHGAASWQLRDGLLTNLICMLVWHILEQNEVESGLQEASINFTNCHWMPFRFNDYYPPDV